MDSVQTLDAGRRSMYDPDEIEEEQRERDTRNKVGQPSCHSSYFYNVGGFIAGVPSPFTWKGIGGAISGILFTK